MAKPKKLRKVILGVVIGIICSQFFFSAGNFCRPRIVRRSAKADKLESLEKFYTDEGRKNLLFAGVMTAKQYLDTRAKAIYDTWGKDVPGRTVIFSSENSTSEYLPLVALRGIDDSYPPQKKSFAMLKYMHDHFIDRYEWFLRADDDVYIRNNKLEEMLRGVDSRKPFFIGQTGRGTKEEKGHLSLDSDENFCMGGPGIIMSRETLKRIAPYIEECLRNLYTTHEDVEVGRCVRRFAGVSCTWNYEMQVIFYHNNSGETAFGGNLKHKEVHKAITLHPLKNPEHMYKLHTYMQGLKIQEALQQSILLHRDIATSMKQLGYRISSLGTANLTSNVSLFPVKKGQEAYLGDTGLLGTPVGITRYQPKKLEDVLEWELISKTLYSHRDLNPRRRIGSSIKEGLADVTREIMELINSFSKQRGRIIDFKEILYGYWRLDPLHGVDLILDLLLVYKKYRGHKMTVQVRRHAYVQQTFTGIFIREVPDPSSPDFVSSSNGEDKNILNQFINRLSNNLPPLLSFTQSDTNKKPSQINFLLPLSGRHTTFVRFLKMYEEVCIKNWESTTLYVILYRSIDSPHDYTLSKKLINQVNSRIKRTYRSDYRTHGSIVIIDGGKYNEIFSRASALQKAVNTLSDSDLMLFIDVDIVFDQKFLGRVRKNTVKDRSVYFPIVYSLYSPKLLDIGIESYSKVDFSYFTENQTDSNRGFWRQFGFGIASMYKADYQALGGFDLSITGWGTEDVTFFDGVVQSHTRRIFRSVDPGLIHVFHEVKCNSDDLDLEQRNMCLGTKGSTLGSMETLQKIFEKYRKLFR